MKKVLILMRILPQYRVDFYNRLKLALEKEEILLSLIHGKSTNSTDLAKKDESAIEWAEYIGHRSIKLGHYELLWFPVFSRLFQYDMIIVEFANKNLINFLLMLMRPFTNWKLAFWGHQRNPFQVRKSLWNTIKRFYLKQCDRWFAYTDQAKDYLIKEGYDEQKITVVQNAIDTAALMRKYNSISEKETGELRKKLGITSNHIGIYCGSIYKEKRLDFLIESVDQVRQSIKDFELIIIGSGPDVPMLNAAIKERPWIHYEGPKFGEDRVIYFKLSSVFLMPGALGLAILDSFALNTPMILTEYTFHGPELAYAKNGLNCIISKNSTGDFADAIIEYYEQPEKMNSLKIQMLAEAKRYSLETMVGNFTSGIRDCLFKNV